MAADFLRAPGSGSSFFLETIAMRFFCTGYIFWINQHSKARLSHGDAKQDRNREGGGVRWAKQAVVGTAIPRVLQSNCYVKDDYLIIENLEIMPITMNLCWQMGRKTTKEGIWY